MPSPQSHARPVLEMSGIRRGYQSLRPLRLESLILVEGERVAVLGIDSAAAEVLVNLVTGAALPEEGTVRVLGHDTTEISSGDQWLASLDRFGIVSPRAVLIESATVEQNLAMPFTLRIDAIPADVTARVAAMAEECGIQTAGERLKQVIGEASPDVRVRVHLARAVALDPSLLLLEHPSAGLPEARRAAFADDVVRVVEGRRVTTLAITQDRLFAARVAQRTFELQPASGALRPVRKGWFS